MTIDPNLVSKDIYPCNVEELDQRVVRGGWTYYVHAVKRPSTLGKAPLSAAAGLTASLFGALVEAGLDWKARNDAWTVGVVRVGYIGSWNDQAPRVIHRESLVAGETPEVRIAELVEQAESGFFDPTS
jgi:hypothetical protein